MHVGNRNWLDDLQARFGGEIAGAALLELGSLDVNGSARECLRPARWLGVDRLHCGMRDCLLCRDCRALGCPSCSGALGTRAELSWPRELHCGVDVRCDAADTRFEPEEFGVLLSTSMIEHDPAWRASLAHNLPWLRRGGLLFLSWGAEGNTHHAPEPWAAVPVGDVLEWSISSELVVVDATWEASRYTGDCAGCYDMVMRRP